MNREKFNLLVLLFAGAGILVALPLCIWSAGNTWFPSDKILQAHPRELALAFGAGGIVDELQVEAGQVVLEGQLLAVLERDDLSREYDRSLSAHSVAKKKLSMMELALKNARYNGASDAGIAERTQSVENAGIKLNNAIERSNSLRAEMEASEVVAPQKGEIINLSLKVDEKVEAGQPVMQLRTHDQFYLFHRLISVVAGMLFISQLLPVLLLVFGCGGRRIWAYVLVSMLAAIVCAIAVIGFGVMQGQFSIPLCGALFTGVVLLAAWAGKTNKRHYNNLPAG